MHLPAFLRPPLRWVNSLPLWRMGRVNVWGHRLRAPNFDRRLCLWLHRAGWMGRADRAFLVTQLRPGMTVVDIGANQGIYTLFFSERVGTTGRVLAFEPDEILYAALENNIAHHLAHNVQPHRLALGSRSGVMTLHRSLINSGDNRLAAVNLGEGPWEPVQTRVERLDAVLSGQRIDLIKMDVQGWEMEVFHGMEGLLDDHRNADLTIYFEFWPQGLQQAGSAPIVPLEFLSRKGFHLFQIVGTALNRIDDLHAFIASVCPSHYINLCAKR